MNPETIKVLLIEGDADQVAAVQHHLRDVPGETPRFEVTGAVRLSAACHLLARDAYDVILLDLVLPQSVGVEGFERVHRQKPRTPIVVLAGFHDLALAEKAVALGAQDHLVKGTQDFCCLRRVLRHAIERQRSENGLLRTLEADAAARVVVDGTGAVLWANGAAEALLARSTLTGQAFPYELPKTPTGEMAATGPDGERRTVEVRAVPLDWHGADARLLTLRETARPAAAADPDEPSALWGRVSHELRNALATVQSAAYCLSDGVAGELSGRQKAMVDIVTRHADRQARLTENVLDLARMRSGRARLAAEEVDVAELLSEAARERSLRRGGRKLEVQAQGPLLTTGDGDLLLQLVRNLAEEAAARARGAVRLVARAAGGAIEVTATHDGPEAEDAPPKGTELALAVCREILARHGGRLEPVEGGAGRWRAVLPARREGVTPASTRSDPRSMASARTGAYNQRAP